MSWRHYYLWNSSPLTPRCTFESCYISRSAWIMGPSVLLYCRSFSPIGCEFSVVFSRCLILTSSSSSLSKATGDTSNEVTYIFMISNPPNQNVINPPPESKSGPQSTSLANPRLPTTLANLGSLSEEMEEAFEKITKANQDTAIASLTTSHTQGANLSQAESPLIDPWLQGPPLSQESPSILDRVLQNSTPKRTRRGGDFDWRFSPMKEPLDFETVKRQWWGREPSTSGATSPLRRPNSEPEDQSKDMILAPSFGSAGSG